MCNNELPMVSLTDANSLLIVNIFYSFFFPYSMCDAKKL